MTSPLAALKGVPEDAPVLVIARFRCRSGDEAEIERRLDAHVRGTHAEVGCERYALHRVVENPCEWMLVERWTSKDAFRAHHRMPHMADLPELAGRLAEPPQVWFLHEPTAATRRRVAFEQYRTLTPTGPGTLLNYMVYKRTG